MPGKVSTKPQWVYLLTPIFCTFIYTLRSIDLADTMTIICPVNQTKMDSNWLFVCGTVPFRNPKPHPPQRAFISGKASKHRCEGCLAFVVVNWAGGTESQRLNLLYRFTEHMKNRSEKQLYHPKPRNGKYAKRNGLLLVARRTNDRPPARSSVICYLKGFLGFSWCRGTFVLHSKWRKKLATSCPGEFSGCHHISTPSRR